VSSYDNKVSSSADEGSNSFDAIAGVVYSLTYGEAAISNISTFGVMCRR
jgi:hypothetical protein